MNEHRGKGKRMHQRPPRLREHRLYRISGRGFFILGTRVLPPLSREPRRRRTPAVRRLLVLLHHVIFAHRFRGHGTRRGQDVHLVVHSIFFARADGVAENADGKMPEIVVRLRARETAVDEDVFQCQWMDICLASDPVDMTHGRVMKQRTHDT